MGIVEPDFDYRAALEAKLEAEAEKSQQKYLNPRTLSLGGYDDVYLP